MELIPVASEMLASIGHDAATGTMQALYKKGGLYEYPDVSADEFIAVLQPGHEHALSVGKAFRAIIQARKVGRKVEGTKASTPPAVLNGTPAPSTPRVVSSSLGAEAPSPLPAEAQAVSRKSTELTVQASEIVVRDPASQTVASDLLLAIAGMRREIADTFKPMKDAAYKAHKTICDQERTLDDPLARAERALKDQIGAFVQEQNRLAAEQERLAREAEQERSTREATERSQELALEQAIDLEARGQTKAAEAVLANPAPVAPRYVAPAPVAPNVAQVKGVTTSTTWDFRITDINAIPREYLLVNEIAIRNMGKNTKGLAKIPGVEFFPKQIVGASRGGRR